MGLSGGRGEKETGKGSSRSILRTVLYSRPVPPHPSLAAAALSATTVSRTLNELARGKTPYEPKNCNPLLLIKDTSINIIHTSPLQRLVGQP